MIYTKPIKTEEILLNRYIGIVTVVTMPFVMAIIVYLVMNNASLVNNISTFFQSVASEISYIFTKEKIEETPTSLPVPDMPSVFEDKLDPIYAKPTRIKIPSVKVDMELITVSVKEDGTMETPTEWKIGGWFKKGGLAGASDNLIINGHYDDNFGRPAAFWQLKNVGVGDKVFVLDAHDREFVYEVSEILFVDPKDVSVLENDGSAKLTLITCSGVWNPVERTYTKRLVVRGVLSQDLATVSDN